MAVIQRKPKSLLVVTTLTVIIVTTTLTTLQIPALAQTMRSLQSVISLLNQSNNLQPGVDPIFDTVMETNSGRFGSGYSQILAETVTYNVPNDTVIESAFGTFLNLYSKNYSSPDEMKYRLAVFKSNMQHIARLNNANGPVAFGINQFADITPAEFSRYFLNYHSASRDFVKAASTLHSKQSEPSTVGPTTFIATASQSTIIFEPTIGMTPVSVIAHYVSQGQPQQNMYMSLANGVFTLGFQALSFGQTLTFSFTFDVGGGIQYDTPTYSYTYSTYALPSTASPNLLPSTTAAPTAAPSSSYAFEVDGLYFNFGISPDAIAFIPSTSQFNKIEYVIVHYTVNNGAQQNVQLSNDGEFFGASINVPSASLATISFTFSINGVQYNTPTYTGYIGSAPTIAPTETPKTTASPNLLPSTTAAPTAAPSSSYAFEVDGLYFNFGISPDAIAFIPSTSQFNKIEYVIVHYTVNNGAQQNVQLSNDGEFFGVSINVPSASLATISFTFSINGVQYNTPTYTGYIGSAPTIAPTETPKTTASPNLLPSTTAAPTAAPSSSYAFEVDGLYFNFGISPDAIAFIPSTSQFNKIEYVIVHYTVNNGAQQNVQLSNDGEFFGVSINVPSASLATISFTFSINGVQYNTPTYTGYIGSAPTIAPTATPEIITTTVSPTTKAPLIVTVDWRSQGVVTPVKNQGQCGACWAFSAVEQLETAVALATSQLNELSVQQLVSCDTLDDGCAGGDPTIAYQYLGSTGVVSATSYPYVSENSDNSYACAIPSDVTETKLSSWSYVIMPCSTNDLSCSEQASLEPAMASAIKASGPASVCLVASTWQYYTGGILTTASGCSSSYWDMDHCAQVVGYVSNPLGSSYWIVRNQWGTSWGVNGYIYLEMDYNVCGIANEVTFVHV